VATTSTNLSLTLPVIADTAKIVDDFNTNMNIIDGRFSAVYLAVQDKSAVTITGGSIIGITDLVVSDGGTGVSTLTDGGVLLGSGTGAITAMAVLADSEMIVGNGTTDPVAESGATLRTSIGVAIGTNVQAYDAGLLSIAALTTAANKIIYTTAHDVYTTTSLSAYGITLIDDADAATARTTLGLVIGTNVQAYDATLLSIAALGTAANKIAYTTGIDTWAEAALTAFAITILDDANAAAVRATLSAAVLGANTDITSVTGLTTPLGVAYGGTGLITGALTLLSATTVSFAADGDTTLYTVPAGNRCVLTHAIVVAAADAGATTTISIGQDTAETDFIPANTLSNLDAQYDAVVVMPIPNTTPLKNKSYAAATVIQAQVATQSGAAGNTVYLFGILY